MRFCTSCGHGNDDDSAFCQACGAALRPKAAAVMQSATPRGPAGGKRRLAIAGSVIAVLIAAGAWFFLAPPAASERNFAASSSHSQSAGGQWKVADTETQGWWPRIKNYFSAVVGGNPLIGKWETSMMGVIMLQYEFTADTMRVGDAVTPVRYEVRDNEVVVYPEGQGAGLIVKVIDQDNIELNFGVAAVKFRRVR
ncbi:zinc ribbon domain-containing protein [Janthinobacterium sp. 17J80-10]|uniref:zinc-ribbon domain-containing protein n=1 Tax=Janthinobacterium sp. 17J80-10 TaxID=2497863 RepID=UPI0013E8AAE6|nr:zinc ribbon domain-containing protein [Janthinobacterium sp. 17J80-10]